MRQDAFGLIGLRALIGFAAPVGIFKRFVVAWIVVATSIVGVAMATPSVRWPVGTLAAKQALGQGCFSVEEAAQRTEAELCVKVHVYDVVELADGTRFLDVCAAGVPDDECRFTIVSQTADRTEVGELRRYLGQDLQVRGSVHSLHGRMGMVLSHVRQLSGGPEKFRPNPKLLRGFAGQSERMPVRDPNLRNTGGRRSFMNTSDREATREEFSKRR